MIRNGLAKPMEKGHVLGRKRMEDYLGGAGAKMKLCNATRRGRRAAASSPAHSRAALADKNGAAGQEGV